MRARMHGGWWVAIAAAAIVGVTAVLGGFLPREDAPVPVVEAGDVLAMELATITIDEVGAGIDADGAQVVEVTMTVTSNVHVPIRVEDLVELVDDDGRLALVPWEVTVDGDLPSSTAQPGVTETFSLTYEPERDVVGDARIEIVDGTFVPRDETSFGLFDNIHDGHVVAVVEVDL